VANRSFHNRQKFSLDLWPFIPSDTKTAPFHVACCWCKPLTPPSLGTNCNWSTLTAYNPLALSCRRMTSQQYFQSCNKNAKIWHLLFEFPSYFMNEHPLCIRQRPT
jgi:hypothetical protein